MAKPRHDSDGEVGGAGDVDGELIVVGRKAPGLASKL